MQPAVIRDEERIYCYKYFYACMDKTVDDTTLFRTRRKTLYTFKKIPIYHWYIHSRYIESSYIPVVSLKLDSPSRNIFDQYIKSSSLKAPPCHDHESKTIRYIGKIYVFFFLLYFYWYWVYLYTYNMVHYYNVTL